ncbi:unnamed protein product [Lupinus luteus]|uniref:Uncharacterized protein n=1 Tax=Lupinus luteus TaxID=3873 RepID=A0AAV1YG10_LUPLU
MENKENMLPFSLTDKINPVRANAKTKCFKKGSSTTRLMREPLADITNRFNFSEPPHVVPSPSFCLASVTVESNFQKCTTSKFVSDSAKYCSSKSLRMGFR